MRIILRDHNGAIVFAMSRKEVRIFEVDDIEALSALRGLQMILHLGFFGLILEGNSLTVIEALNSRASNFSKQGSLIIEIQSLLQRFKIMRFCMLEDRVMRLLTC